ncbi:MAG: Holliday junction branch migration protein RuvA [Chloroflexota bacterium]|nr:Holliday junction branch migration protein RuvA [Chloroflexota bacterium]
MIRLVRGTVTARGKDFLVVEIGGGGIGLKVFATDPTLVEFNSGTTVLLHTYLQVREDALTLFGFATEDELGMFESLLTVSGVGPKVALSILSTFSPDALRLALANDEPALVARAPGVGKRTAQKIVLDLKDKVRGPMGGLQALALATDADSEVIDALTALGYSVVEAQRAVQKLPKEVVGVEERLRYALSQFGS